MTEFIIGIVSSVVTLIGSYFVFKKNDKSNQLKYITKERQKWREKIRELSVEFIYSELYDNATEFIYPNKKKLINISAQVAVRLNPNDDEDNYILCLMSCYMKNENVRESLREELNIAFASLLKHDWERAKNETKMKSNSSKIILFLISLFIVTSFFVCSNWIPEKINFFTYEACLKNNTSFSDLFFVKAIIYVLLILLGYQFLKYLRWRRNFRKENNLTYFFKEKDLKRKSIYRCVCENKKSVNITCNEVWNKYLGYTTRNKLS